MPRHDHDDATASAPAGTGVPAATGVFAPGAGSTPTGGPAPAGVPGPTGVVAPPGVGAPGGGTTATDAGPTGDPAVDAALSRLPELDGLPVRDHVAVLDAVHAALQDRLADVED